jgi:hypothetical protein
MKIDLKDILTLTLVNAKKQVKDLTDSQVSNLLTKINKLITIVGNESDIRYKNILLEDAENEVDDYIESTIEEPVDDEV